MDFILEYSTDIIYCINNIVMKSKISSVLYNFRRKTICFNIIFAASMEHLAHTFKHSLFQFKKKYNYEI